MTHITMSRRGARADPDNYVVDHVINYASLATRREPAPIANPHPSPFQLDTAWGRRLKRRAHRARSPGECHRHELSQLLRSEEHTSELQSLMRLSYAVFCSKKKNTPQHTAANTHNKLDLHRTRLPSSNSQPMSRSCLS